MSESGVLRPGETYEVVCNIEFVFKRAAEEERAQKALQFATEAFSKSRVSKGLRQADRGRLLAAQAALDTAKAAYESLKRRSDAITDFIQQIKGFRNAHKDAKRHDFLLR